MKDDKWVVRAAAVNALAKRDDRRHAGQIASLLDDEHETVRFNAAAAVIRLTPKRYFSDAMSITNRYFTSLLSIRS